MKKVNKKSRCKYNIHKMFIRLKDGQEYTYSMNGVEIDNLERFRNNVMERKFVNLDKKEVLFGYTYNPDGKIVDEREGKYEPPRGKYNDKDYEASKRERKANREEIS